MRPTSVLSSTLLHEAHPTHARLGKRRASWFKICSWGHRVEGGWKKRAQNFSTFRSLPRPSLVKPVQHMRDFGFMLEGDLLVRSRESYSVLSLELESQ